MHDRRKAGEQSSYLAESGVLVKQDDTAYLVMQNGHIVRRASAKDDPQIITFQTYAIDLSTFERGQGNRRYKARELYTSELLDPKIKAKATKKDRKKYVPELHERFAGVLYPFAFVLIALATVGNAQSTRDNRNKALTNAILLASLARLTGLGLNNFVASNPHMFFVLYLLPSLAIVLALIAIRRNARPRVANPKLEALQDRVRDGVRRLFGRFTKRSQTLPAKV